MKLNQAEPINYTAMIVKYIINVLIFAMIYAFVELLLLFFNVNGVVANVAGIVVAVLTMMNLMKKIGPWVDRRLTKK